MFLLINCDLKLKNRIYPKILIQSLPNTFFCKSSFALKIFFNAINKYTRNNSQSTGHGRFSSPPNKLTKVLTVPLKMSFSKNTTPPYK